MMASPTNPDTKQIQAMFQRASTDCFYQQLAEEFGIGSGGGIYSLPVVIWLMIFQRLNSKGTLAAAVQEVVREMKGRRASVEDCKRIRDGKVSSHTGGYCQARQNLPNTGSQSRDPPFFRATSPTDAPRRRRAHRFTWWTIYVAACREGLPPRDYSFSVSQDALMAAWGDLQRATTKAAFNRELDLLIFFVSQTKLPRRSGRRAYPRIIWGRGGHFPFRPSTATKEPAK